MTRKASKPPLLDAARAQFIRGPVAINLASHDAACLPSIARGYGCKLSADRQRLTVFLSVRSAEAVLRDLRAGAPIAVTFCRPESHATLQVKGERASVGQLGPRDRAVMRAYGAAFRDEIASLGYNAAFSSRLAAPVEDDAVAVEFEPVALFDQTPGPDAGKSLVPKS